MGHKFSLYSVIATAFILTACENNPAIFRHFGLSQSDEAIIIDAKQRILTRTFVTKDTENSNRIEPKVVTCSEPSPDVAQAISNSISAALAATLKSGATVDARVAHSTAESIAQLGERIATIQLLRDELSDLCRSYANGAVTATTYTLRLSKLDRKMVTLLIGEMTAGAFGRSLANISGSAGADSRKVDEEKLKEAQENVSKAQEEVEMNRAALGAIKSDDDPDGKKRSEARSNLTESTKTLHSALQVELAIRRGQLAVNSGASTDFGIGSIARQIQSGDGATAEKLALIQRQFLEHDDLGTFIDACLTSMDLLTKKREGSGPLSEKIVLQAQNRTKDVRNQAVSLQEDVIKIARRISELRGNYDIADETKTLFGEELTGPQLQVTLLKLQAEIGSRKEELGLKEKLLEDAEVELFSAKENEKKLIAATLEAQKKTPLSPLGTKCEEILPTILTAVQERHSNVSSVRMLELENEKIEKMSDFESKKTIRLTEEAKTNTAAVALAVSQDNLEKTRATTETLLSCRTFMQSPSSTQFPDAVKNFCAKSLEKLTPQ